MATLVGSLTDNKDTNSPEGSNRVEGGIVQWVMGNVDPWRDERNQNYERVWGEYYRLWRGRHIAADKTRESERSKLVAPALSQALEMTVAELEEATFGRGQQWIDIIDDAGDPDHEDINSVRLQFVQDLETDKVPEGIADCFLNGGLWGTLAAKVVVEARTEPTFVQGKDESTGLPIQKVDYQPRVHVKLVPIPASDLIPDPEGEVVEDMLGIAHEVSKPRAYLLGTDWGRDYAKNSAKSPGVSADTEMTFGDQETLISTDSNKVLITEYHGKVPRRLLTEITHPTIEDPEDPLASAVVGGDRPIREGGLDGEDMVEAIVTILDKKHLARAIENPFMMQDRSIVTCQYETVPGRFFGRGVMEKGYNPQKALDAELRTRMDVMALIANPMMGVDQTALPRGFDNRVRPGKIWATNGNPKEALFPLQFPGLDPTSFSQTSEMERMVQMGTGAMDSATPLAGNRRNETSGGTSMIAGTFVKRTKRALRKITSGFIHPVIQKILWRRMEFDSGRYPKDFQFRVAGTLGIVARELEQNQMTQMLGLVEPGSQAQGVIIRSIVDASASPYKAELVKAIEADAQPSEAEQQQQQMQMQLAQLEMAEKQMKVQQTGMDMKKTEAETLLTIAKFETEMQKPGVEVEKLRQARDKLVKEFGELQEFARQNDIAAFKVMGDIENAGQSNNTGHSTTNAAATS